MEAGQWLVVAEMTERSGVLGPGLRSVVWVQGCPFRCPSCISTEFLPFEGGSRMAVEDVADRLLDTSGIEGVTFSGGEPFAQAGALAALCRTLRSRSSLSLMAYTGFTLETLRKTGTPDQHSLLEQLDLLIDGRYVEGRHAPLRWRGSTNQRVHLLSERYGSIRDEPDVSAGVEVEIGANSSFRVIGVPPVPGFRASLESQLAARGVVVQPGGSPI